MFRLQVDLLLLLLLLFLLVFLERERETLIKFVRSIHFFRQLRSTKQTETSRTTRARSNFSGPARFFFYIDIFLESQFLSILEISFLNSFQFSRKRFSFHLSTRDEIRNFSPDERKRERIALPIDATNSSLAWDARGARNARWRFHFARREIKIARARVSLSPRASSPSSLSQRILYASSPVKIGPLFLHLAQIHRGSSRERERERE